MTRTCVLWPHSASLCHHTFRGFTQIRLGLRIARRHPMLRRLAGLLVMAPVAVIAQSICPPVNFLVARTINLKPSATSHIDAVRQSDGSYTGFE